MPYKDPAKAREYSKQYHIRTWEDRKGRHYKQKVKRMGLLIDWFRQYKEDVSCIRCGESNSICLDFHHIDVSKKDHEISAMIGDGYSREWILAEIEKCIVLCANCHRKEHGV